MGNVHPVGSAREAGLYKTKARGFFARPFAPVLVLGVLLTACGQANETVAAFSVEQDTQPPTLTAVMAPSSLQEEGFVFFFLNSRDNVAVTNTVITIDGQPFVQDETGYNSYARFFTASDNGLHQVRVRVMDAANNLTEVTGQINVQIGNPAP